MGASVGHEAAFLTGNGVYPAGVELAQLGLLHDGLLVGQGEADIQVIPMLGLADAANGREVPVHLAGQGGLGDEFFAVEQAFGVVPLAARIQVVTPGKELPCADDSGGIGNLCSGLGIHAYRLVIDGVGTAAAFGGKKTVEVTLLGQLGVLLGQLARGGLGHLAAAQLPVPPAALLLHVLRHVAGQFQHVMPLTSAQCQAPTPFGDAVIQHQWVVGGHEGQSFRLVAAGQTHADVPGQREALFISEWQVLILWPECQSGIGIIPAQATQGDYDHIDQFVLGLAGVHLIVAGLAQTCGVGGGGHEAFGQPCLAGQITGKVLGQGVLTVQQGQADTLPGNVFSQPAGCSPALEQWVADIGL